MRHDEGVTRGSRYDHLDRALFLDPGARRSSGGDPYYNPALSLAGADYRRRRVNVVFVNYHDFTSNSAVHIGGLADELSAAGLARSSSPGTRTVTLLGDHTVPGARFPPARDGGLRFPDGKPPTLVHAWTPRERFAADRGAQHPLRLPVLRAPRGQRGCDHRRPARADARSCCANGDSTPRSGPSLAHPRRMRRFLAGAAGITVIIDRLLEFRPDGVPAEVVWPAYETDLFTADPADPELRRRLGIADDEAVIVYAGNAHRSNAAEMRSLYLAVAAVNRAGRPLRLVRLGRDFVAVPRARERHVNEHVVDVPLRAPRRGRSLPALADVLVQPGRADDFNEYRFPSKLTEFLATGRPGHPPAHEPRPVARGRRGMPAAAPRRRVRDRDGDRASPGRRRATRAARHGSAGFRRAHLQLARRAPRSCAASTSRRSAGRPGRRREPRGGRLDVPVRRRGSRPAALSYATVRDYCDSADRLPPLAGPTAI